MKETEKRLIEANTRLVEENRLLRNDILTLIQYIKFNKHEYEVNNLIEKYEKYYNDNYGRTKYD